MGDTVKVVRDAMEAAVDRSEGWGQDIVVSVGSKEWVLHHRQLRAFLDATKAAEPKPSELLDKLADDIIEARRYVRSNPEHARKAVEAICDRVIEFNTPCGEEERIRDNMVVGSYCILSDPGVLEGYLYGAAAEVRGWADARRKEGE